MSIIRILLIVRRRYYSPLNGFPVIFKNSINQGRTEGLGLGRLGRAWSTLGFLRAGGEGGLAVKLYNCLKNGFKIAV